MCFNIYPQKHQLNSVKKLKCKMKEMVTRLNVDLIKFVPIPRYMYRSLFANLFKVPGFVLSKASGFRGGFSYE